MIRFLRPASLLLGGAVVLTACARAPTPEAVSDADLHGLMTRRISALWNQIEVLAFDQHRTQPELDAERQRKSRDIALAAAELQQAARTILSLQPQLGLDAERGSRFNALAERLRADAASLQALAEDRRYAALQQAVQRTMETCATCHQLYRSP
ncbi:MAG: hypothetical protein RLZZ385_429 [Pseudomonadota bacterium]